MGPKAMGSAVSPVCLKVSLALSFVGSIVEGEMPFFADMCRLGLFRNDSTTDGLSFDSRSCGVETVGRTRSSRSAR